MHTKRKWSEPELLLWQALTQSITLLAAVYRQTEATVTQTSQDVSSRVFHVRQELTDSHFYSAWVHISLVQLFFVPIALA